MLKKEKNISWIQTKLNGSFLGSCATAPQNWMGSTCIIAFSCSFWHLSVVPYQKDKHVQTVLKILFFPVVSSLRRTPASSASWWTPTRCCQSTQRRSSTCTKGRKDMKCPLTSTPSLITPTETWCKVGFLYSIIVFLMCCTTSRATQGEKHIWDSEILYEWLLLTVYFLQMFFVPCNIWTSFH